MGERTDAEDALTTTIRAIADEDSALEPSPNVERTLRSVVRALRKARTRRAYGLALAAAAVWLIVILLPGRRTPQAPSIDSGTPTEVGSDFQPLMYADVPMSEGRIVRLEVSRAALVRFGLATVDAVVPSSSETALADVIVGEDGLARAVSFVRVQNQEPRR